MEPENSVLWYQKSIDFWHQRDLGSNPRSEPYFLITKIRKGMYF